RFAPRGAPVGAAAKAAGGGPRRRAGGGFGRRPDLGHTVQVALSRAVPGRGIRPAPTRAPPVPPRSATNSRRGPVPARATHPTAGGRCTRTGKQRRQRLPLRVGGTTDHRGPGRAFEE